MHYYFEKGYRDATDENQLYQSIGITGTENGFVISESNEVLFWNQVPNIETVATFKELCEKMAEKDWQLSQ